MPDFLKDFHDHPESVGETYGQHWYSAMCFAMALLASAIACMVHAFVPGLFKKTASGNITALYQRMVMHRHRAAAGQPGASDTKTA